MSVRIIRFVLLLVVSWCVMAVTHESGHIVAGWFCGARLIDADVAPWHLPYSLFSPDPMPLVTLWGGPILGVAAPVILAFLFRNDWMWFIANFCLLANGTYLLLAWFSGDPYLDTTKLLQHGASPVLIASYSLITVSCGYLGLRQACVREFAKIRAPSADLQCQDHSETQSAAIRNVE